MMVIPEVNDQALIDLTGISSELTVCFYTDFHNYAVSSIYAENAYPGMYLLSYASFSKSLRMRT